MTERFDYIRGVSGYGPRCGCGGESTIHVGNGSAAQPGIFFCAECVTQMVKQWFSDYPDQPPYWPGDEDRDEHYTDPRKESRCK